MEATPMHDWVWGLYGGIGNVYSVFCKVAGRRASATPAWRLQQCMFGSSSGHFTLCLESGASLGKRKASMEATAVRISRFWGLLAMIFCVQGVFCMECGSASSAFCIKQRIACVCMCVCSKCGRAWRVHLNVVCI
eukprot:1157579-Pelagomonas_calceolata.AAC.2